MSKIPTVNAFIEANVRNEDGSNKSIQQLIKEYGELVRVETLKVAAEEANMIGVTQHNNGAPNKTSDFVYVVDSNGPDYGYTVNQQSILDLINSPNLEIK